MDSRREWRGSESPATGGLDGEGGGFIIPGVSSEAVEQKPDRREDDGVYRRGRRRLVDGGGSALRF